jgi:hypothetical protein
MKLILKSIILTAALLVIASTGRTAELSIVPEVGLVHMSSAPDDFWYEQALPHTTDFDSAAFGASLKLTERHLQVSAGWRNLGNQHQSAQIIGDAAYFACRGNPSTCPPTSQYWTETGSEQQVFGEIGYAFNLWHGFRLVPSVGFAETRITSHVQMYNYPSLVLREQGGGNVQWLPKVFYGITVQKGPVGVGLYQLNTEPNRGANSWTSPIQGSSALYLRLTYDFKL